MVADLYALLPSLKPFEPVDSSNSRYLNQSYSPIVNPLRKPLNIELYNEIRFDKPPRTSKALFDYDHFTLAFPECPSTSYPLLSYLHDESRTPCTPPLIEQFDTDILSPFSPLVLFNSLSNSHGLFFIRYTPEDTFEQRWLLVQINHEDETKEISFYMTHLYFSVHLHDF